MPELTIVYHQQCKELSARSVVIQSFTNEDKFYTVTYGDDYNYPSCTCPAYMRPRKMEKFHGRFYPAKCKHIKYAEEHRCRWHSAYSPEQQVTPGVCPVCHGEAETVRVGV